MIILMVLGIIIAVRLLKKAAVFTVVAALAVLAFSVSPWYATAKTALGLGAPAASEFAPTPYMTMDGASPVRWSSCGPIRYEVNFNGAPADAPTNLALALETLSRYTHFTFVPAGTTNAVPQANWITQHLPAPLVIAWATPSTSSLLGQSHELSIGSVASVGSSPNAHYVSGVVVMDSSATANLPSGIGPGSLALLLLHELSHAMGLAHSHNPLSYMYPYFTGLQGITPADAQHLANLHPKSC